MTAAALPSKVHNDHSQNGGKTSMAWFYEISSGTAQYLRTIGTLLYFVIRFAHGEDSEGDHLESGSVA
jgi:hypothetical protein